jgi:hypothetical protein
MVIRLHSPHGSNRDYCAVASTCYLYVDIGIMQAQLDMIGSNLAWCLASQDIFSPSRMTKGIWKKIFSTGPVSGIITCLDGWECRSHSFRKMQ